MSTKNIRTPQRRKAVDPRAAKSRDIGRSVLPSTARRAAHTDLSHIRRGDRRANNVATRAALAPCACEVAERCQRCDPFEPFPVGEQRAAVRDRREHDKLGPLLRWGEATVARTGDNGAAAVRRVLPPGIIGSHALSHLAAAGVVVDGRWVNRWWWGTQRREPVPWREVLADVGRFAIESGRLKELNKLLARPALTLSVAANDRRWAAPIDAHVAGRRPTTWNVSSIAPARFALTRPLRGSHDVEVWAGDVVSGFGGWERTFSLVIVWAADRGWRNRFGPAAGAAPVAPPWRGWSTASSI